MIDENLRGESVEQVCKRFLLDALREAPTGQRFAYCRERAESCMRNFRTHEQGPDLTEFYLRVHAYFSEG